MKILLKKSSRTRIESRNSRIVCSSLSSPLWFSPYLDSWNCLRTCLASTLPNSTPHWSKEQTFQTNPYIWPSTKSRIPEQQFYAHKWPAIDHKYKHSIHWTTRKKKDDYPWKSRRSTTTTFVHTLWGNNSGLTPSFSKSSWVLPQARASGWAKKLDINSSWLETTYEWKKDKKGYLTLKRHRLLGVLEANEIGRNNTTLMNQLIEGVLTIGTRLTKIDLTSTEGDRSTVHGHTLTIALHIDLRTQRTF